MKTIVIYHRADNDGLCCREIARHFLGGEVELYGLDYKETPPLVPHDARLYILDLSVPELMDHPGLVWIDHHKTAIETYSPRIPGYRIEGVAACRLAWQWFIHHARAVFSGDEIITGELPAKRDYVERLVLEPEAVRLIGENDIWDHRDPNVALFKAGLRSVDVDWPKLLDRRPWSAGEQQLYVERILARGEAVAHASREGLRFLLAENAFELRWLGLRWLAINAAGLASDAYALAGGDYDAGLSFCWNPKQRAWKVSMRALRPGLDLTPIAKAHGGGGHPAACGFSCGILPFSLIEEAVPASDASATQKMNGVGQLLHSSFPDRAWFSLVFPKQADAEAHYISNASREEVGEALAGLLSQFKAAPTGLPPADVSRN